MVSTTVQVALSSIMVTVVSLLLFLIVWDILYSDISSVKSSVEDLSSTIQEEASKEGIAMTSLYLSVNTVSSLNSSITQGLINYLNYADRYARTGDDTYFTDMLNELTSVENATSQALSTLNSMLSSSSTLNSSSATLLSSLISDAKSSLTAVQSVTTYVSSMDKSTTESMEVVSSLRGLIYSLENNFTVSSTFTSESGDLVLGGLDTTWSSVGLNLPSSDEWSLSLKSNEVLEVSTSGVQWNAGDFSVSLSSDGSFVMNDGFTAGIVNQESPLVEFNNNSINLLNGVMSLSPALITVTVDEGSSSLRWTGDNWGLTVGEGRIQMSENDVSLSGLDTVSFTEDQVTIAVGNGSSYLSWNPTQFSVGFVDGGLPAMTLSNNQLLFGQVINVGSGVVSTSTLNFSETLTSSSPYPLEFVNSSVTLTVDGGSSYVTWGSDSFGIVLSEGANSYELTSTGLYIESDGITISVGGGSSAIQWTDSSLSLSFNDSSTASFVLSNGLFRTQRCDNNGLVDGDQPAVTVTNSRLLFGQVDTLAFSSGQVSFTDADGIPISINGGNNYTSTIVSSAATPLAFTSNGVTISVGDGSSSINWSGSSFALNFESNDSASVVELTPSTATFNEPLILSPSEPLEFTASSVTITVDSGSSYLQWSGSSLSVGFEGGSSEAFSFSNDGIVVGSPANLQFSASGITLSVDSGSSYINWTESEYEIGFENGGKPALSLTNEKTVFNQGQVILEGSSPFYLTGNGPEAGSQNMAGIYQSGGGIFAAGGADTDIVFAVAYWGQNENSTGMPFYVSTSNDQVVSTYPFYPAAVMLNSGNLSSLSGNTAFLTSDNDGSAAIGGGTTSTLLGIYDSSLNRAYTFGTQGVSFSQPLSLSSDTPLEFTASSITITVDSSSYLQWSNSSLSLGFEGGSSEVLTLSNDEIAVGSPNELAFSASNVTISVDSGSSYINWSGSSFSLQFESGVVPFAIADSSFSVNMRAQFNNLVEFGGPYPIYISASGMSSNLEELSYPLIGQWGSGIGILPDSAATTGPYFTVFEPSSRDALYSFSPSSAEFTNQLILSPGYPLSFESSDVTITVDTGSSYVNWSNSSLSLGFADGSSPSISLSNDSLQLALPSSLEFGQENVTISVDGGSSYLNWTDSSISLGFESGSEPALTATDSLFTVNTRSQFTRLVQVGGNLPVYLGERGASQTGLSYPLLCQDDGGFGVISDSSGNSILNLMNPAGDNVYNFYVDDAVFSVPIQMSSSEPLVFTSDSITITVDGGSSYIQWSDTSLSIGFEGGSAPFTVTDSLFTVNTRAQFTHMLEVGGEYPVYIGATGTAPGSLTYPLLCQDGQGFGIIPSGSGDVFTILNEESTNIYLFSTDSASFYLPLVLTSSEPLEFTASSVTVTVDSGSSYIQWSDAALSIGFEGGSMGALALSNDEIIVGTASEFVFSASDITLTVDSGSSYMHWTGSELAVGFENGGNPALSLSNDYIAVGEPSSVSFEAEGITISVNSGSSYVYWNDNSFSVGLINGSEPAITLTNNRLLFGEVDTLAFASGQVTFTNATTNFTSTITSSATTPLSFTASGVTILVDDGSSSVNWSGNSLALNFTVDAITELGTGGAAFEFTSGSANFNEQLVLSTSEPLAFSASSVTLTVDSGSSYVTWSDSSLSLGFVDGTSPSISLFNDSVQLNLPSSLEFGQENITISVDGGSSYLNWTDSSISLGFESGSEPALTATDSLLTVNTRSQFTRLVQVGGAYPVYLGERGTETGLSYPLLCQDAGGFGIVPSGTGDTNILALMNSDGENTFVFYEDNAVFDAPVQMSSSEPLVFASDSITITVDGGSSYLQWSNSSLSVGFEGGSTEALSISNDAVNIQQPSVVEFTANGVTVSVDQGSSYMNWTSTTFDLGFEGQDQPSLSVTTSYLNTNGEPVVPAETNYSSFSAAIGTTYSNPSPSGVYLLNLGVGESSSTSSGLMGFQLSAEEDYKFLYPNTSSGISYWSTIMMKNSTYSFGSLSGIDEPSSIMVKSVRLC
ncbi:hypothetical protein Gasu2_33960 [Galdieria sulphuraria]|nr:hypothetical protein Gasu2_33960 [Galdieria sulphuraria]